MDAKLQEKFEAKLKDGFLRKKDRTELSPKGSRKLCRNW